MNEDQLHRLSRVRAWVAVFIVGLVLGGATAIPLETELSCLVRWTGAEQLAARPTSTDGPGWAVWLVKVRDALV